MKTPFQHTVAKYLAANTMYSAAPWIEIALSPTKVLLQEAEDEYCYTGDSPQVSSKPLSTFIQVFFLSHHMYFF